MPNTLTDQYHLVTISTVDAGFWGKKINYHDGFSRELFDGGKRLGSILSDADTRRASNGNTILTVNLGLITLKFSDRVETANGYMRAYDAAILMRVLDPKTFSVNYQQQTDPLNLAREAIHSALVRETKLLDHDAVTDVKMQYMVERQVIGAVPEDSPADMMRRVSLLPSLGIAIVEAQTIIIHPDPRRVKEIEDEHKVRLEKARLEREKAMALAKLEADAELERARMYKQADFDRKKAEEDAKLAEKQRVIQAEFDKAKLEADDELAVRRRRIDVRQLDESLEDERKRKEHERAQHELDVLKQEELDMRIQMGRRRMKVLLELYESGKVSGASDEDMLNQYPELGSVIKENNPAGVLPPFQNRRAIGDAEQSQADTTTTQLIETHGVASEERDARQHIISHLGIKVTQETLDSDQMTWSQATSNRVFQVQGFVGEWAGTQQLKRGDFLVQVDDEAPTDLALLTSKLDRAEREHRQVKVTVLRGEQVKVFGVAIPPATSST